MSDLKVSCAKKGSRAYRKMSHHRGRIARAGASTAAPSIGAGRLGRSAGAGDHDRYRPCRGTPAARARPCAGEPSARSPKAGTRWRSAPRRKRLRKRGSTAAWAYTTYPIRPKPREITHWSCGGRGVHRFTCDGRYAYLSPELDGYLANIVMILDLIDPAHTREIGRWWLPGQWIAGGESPT
jgi:hypothetical protein